MGFDWSTIGALVGIPLGRAVLGWLENSLKDWKISHIEIAQLASTIVRVGTVSTAAWLGFTFAGLDISVVATTFGAVVFDFVLMKLTKKTTAQ